jgi:hypothetical protein
VSPYVDAPEGSVILEGSKAIEAQASCVVIRLFCSGTILGLYIRASYKLSSLIEINSKLFGQAKSSIHM